MMTKVAGLLILATLWIGTQGAAMARGHGRGMGMGKGMGMGMRCARMLLKAHPEMLKARLGLSDGQVKKIQGIRTNFFKKKIQSKAQLQLQRLQMMQLMQVDLPDQKKVLTLSRKVRGIRGKLMEEHIKTHIKLLSLMTKDQRTQLRSKCFAHRGWRGKGMRHGRGGHGPRGRRGGGGGGRWAGGGGWN